MLDLFSGDLNLIPDLPELSGLAESELPPGYHYVGPIFARLPLPIPNKVFDVFGRPGLKIYFAMGSSAQPDLFRKIALILRDSGHNVVMACTNIIDPAELEPLPDNVYAARFLRPIWSIKWLTWPLFTGDRARCRPHCKPEPP